MDPELVNELEAVLLDYIERYGLTQRAFAFFNRHPMKERYFVFPKLRCVEEPEDSQ